MTTAIEVHGVCDSRFAAVRDAFAENFASRGEIGAAVAAVVDGETVVYLGGGHSDAARSRPWRIFQSIGLTLAAVRLTRRSPGPGVGIGTSS